MVTFAQLRDARPSQLTAAAEVWEQRAKDTGRRVAEMQAEVIGMLSQWSGPASQAAGKKLKKLVDELTEARKAMLGISDILGQAGTTITSAQTDLVDAIAYAHGQGLTVENDGSVSWLDWNPLEWAQDRAAAQHASDLIEQALQRATNADTDAAADLHVGQLVGQDKASVQALAMSDNPQVEKATQRFRKLLDKAGSFELNGNRDELQKIAQTVEGLSPAEREAFLAQLSNEELKTLRGYMGGTSGNWANPFDANGLPHWDRLDLDTLLMSTVSAEGVTRLAGVWPKLQPTPPEGSDYQKPGGPLDDGDKSWQDVNQGGVGDCWALAVLAGEGHGNPDAYQDMVRPNPNGTVSVRLYDDSGNPHWVTVTGDLPVNGSGDLAGVSGDSGRDAGNAENWPAYVEKALARSYEDGDDSTTGYENINADWPDQSIETLTGKEAHNIDASDASAADIRQRVDSGETVTVSTQGNDQGPYIHTNESGNLVGGHAYFVKDVLPDGRVVLGNPWGASNPDGEVILTQEEIQRYGTKVSVEG